MTTVVVRDDLVRHRHVYNNGNGILTALRYQHEILRPYAGVVGPGILLVKDRTWPHADSVWTVPG